MSVKVFWQTLLVWRAARTMLCMTSRFLRHIWNWSGTSPASSRQWWLSFQATPLPLSVSPLRGEGGCQRGGTTDTPPGTQPERGSPKRGHGGGCGGASPPGSLLTATGWPRRAPAGRAARRRRWGGPWPGMGMGPGLIAAAAPFYRRRRRGPLPPLRGGAQRRFRCHSQRVRAGRGWGEENGEGVTAVISCDHPRNSSWEVMKPLERLCTVGSWGASGLACYPTKCSAAAYPFVSPQGDTTQRAPTPELGHSPPLAPSESHWITKQIHGSAQQVKTHPCNRLAGIRKGH